MRGFWETVIARLTEVLEPTTLGDRLAVLIINLIVGLVVFVAFYVAWRILRSLLGSALTRGHVDETTISFVENASRYTILIVGIVAALNAAGVRTAGLLASLGIAGLTVGFAARDALSNIISGVLIFLDRPFVIGDLVEIEGIYGRVDKITLRSTRIVTVDGKMVAVPNTEVINSTVASYTNFPHLRLDIDITIGVNEDIGRARQVLLDMVRYDPEMLPSPAPRVVVTELGDYFIALQLQAWVDEVRQHTEKRYALRERCYEALLEEGIDMPYETFRLHMMRPDPDQSATQEKGQAS